MPGETMKLSVLLPTRNRLTFLRYAIESVRRQDVPDWEIIVSDNHSEEDIAGYIRGPWTCGSVRRMPKNTSANIET